jgi:guanine deaminase
MAITASRMLESGVDPALRHAERGCPSARIGVVEAFWLATAGGGIVLDLPVGLFQPGRMFDALLVDAEAPDGNLRFDPADRPAQRLERIVHTAGRANIARVWVGGRVVQERGNCRAAASRI